ncbi:MAG: DUF4293 domain-containing protein [Candidatus Amoebophilus sp.]
MLQRIQTVFLLLIVITICIFLFLPIWHKTDLMTLHSYTIYAWQLKELDLAKNLIHNTVMPYALLGSISVVIGLVAVYEIIRFDNRRLQLQLGALNSLLLTALVGLIIYLVTKSQTALLPNVAGSYCKFGFSMPIVAVINNLLANYFIRKDEKLVRSIDRIR